MGRCSVCEGFALIFLIKHSFTWDMGLFWLHHPFIYLSLMKQPRARPPIMECKTGNPPLLTKAIILLNVFHLFSSVTQKPYTRHIIRSCIFFWTFAFLFIHAGEWENKQLNHPSVWLCLAEVRKDRQINKCIILFSSAPQKNKCNTSQKRQESVEFLGRGVLLRNMMTFETTGINTSFDCLSKVIHIWLRYDSRPWHRHCEIRQFS